MTNPETVSWAWEMHIRDIINVLLAHYILTSVCIFSILFSILFLRCWQGESVYQELFYLVIVSFFLVTLMCDSRWYCKEKLDISHSKGQWVSTVSLVCTIGCRSLFFLFWLMSFIWAINYKRKNAVGLLLIVQSLELWRTQQNICSHNYC